jgi:hypothetical protein
LIACLDESYEGSGKYYPDWEGDNEGCLQDLESTKAPKYMGQTGAWFFDTLDACCDRHYAWNMSCKGATGSGTNKYYVDWNQFKCVKDCNTEGDEACAPAEGSWDIVNAYDTKEECCQKRVWWDQRTCLE